MIEYEWVKDNITAVFLDRKRVGKICKTPLGYQYFPKGSDIVGEPFKTIELCKASLEDDE